MRKIITLVYIILVVAISVPLLAQPISLGQEFTVPQLKEDLATLKDQLEKVHVGLYTYTPKSKMDLFFKDMEHGITQPMTSLEFYRYLSPINTKIRNGHSVFIPSNDIVQFIRTKQKLFPLDVYWDQGQLFVLKNNTQNDAIQEGMEIITINDQPANQVFQEIVNNIWRDGYNTTLPERIVSDRFYHFFAFMNEVPDTFDLVLQAPNKEPITIQVAALSPEEINKTRETKYGKEKSWWEKGIPALEVAIDGKIATMTIRTFSTSYAKKSKQKFKKFYKSAFTKIKEAGVEHLIIDLRDNGGGDPMPTIELFAHLHPKPFTFYKNITMKVKRIPDKQLYPNSFWDRLALSLGTKKKGSIYKPNGLAKAFLVQGLKPSKPNKPYYSGEVYVLTNARSFSATGEMSAIIKEHNRAIFIGEETGGNPNENVSGIMLPLTLPHTKNRIVMSFMRWEMNVNFENTGRGIIPDYPIRPSVQDMIDGRDAMMDFTLDLIKKDSI